MAFAADFDFAIHYPPFGPDAPAAIWTAVRFRTGPSESFKDATHPRL